MPVIFLRKRSLPRPSVLIIVRQSDQEAELSRAASNYVAEFVNGNSIGTVKFAADRRAVDASPAACVLTTAVRLPRCWTNGASNESWSLTVH